MESFSSFQKWKEIGGDSIGKNVECEDGDETIIVKQQAEDSKE